MGAERISEISGIPTFLGSKSVLNHAENKFKGVWCFKTLQGAKTIRTTAVEKMLIEHKRKIPLPHKTGKLDKIKVSTRTRSISVLVVCASIQYQTHGFKITRVFLVFPQSSKVLQLTSKLQVQ